MRVVGVVAHEAAGCTRAREGGGGAHRADQRAQQLVEPLKGAEELEDADEAHEPEGAQHREVDEAHVRQVERHVDDREQHDEPVEAVERVAQVVARAKRDQLRDQLEGEDERERVVEPGEDALLALGLVVVLAAHDDRVEHDGEVHGVAEGLRGHEAVAAALQPRPAGHVEVDDAVAVLVGGALLLLRLGALLVRARLAPPLVVLGVEGLGEDGQEELHN